MHQIKVIVPQETSLMLTSDYTFARRKRLFKTNLGCLQRVGLYLNLSL